MSKITKEQARQAASMITGRNAKAMRMLAESVYLLQQFPDDDHVHAIRHKNGELFFYSQSREALEAVYNAATDGKTPIKGRKIRELKDEDFVDWLESGEVQRLPEPRR
jgi:hypothetical protein